VDIAPTMLSEAQRLHARFGNVEFRLIAGVPDPEDKHFDLIWSVLVLQHLGPWCRTMHAERQRRT
jgi:hypothetical protein